MDEEQIPQADSLEEQSPPVEETENVNESPAEEEEEAELEASEPQEEPEADEVEESYPEMELTPTEVPQFDVNALPRDEDGNVPADALAQAMNQWANQVLTTATSQSQQVTALTNIEKTEWDRAIDKYPQLKDADMRGIVKSIRDQSVLENGGKSYLSPVKAADRLFAKVGQAKKEGMQAAQKSVRIQESARLETADTTSAPQSQTRANIMDRVFSGDRRDSRAARQEWIKSMLDEGEIQL